MNVDKEIVEKAIAELRATNKKVTISAVMKLTGYYYYALINAGYQHLAGKYTKKVSAKELEEFEDIWVPRQEAPAEPKEQGEHFLAEFKEGDKLTTATFKDKKELLSYIESQINLMDQDKTNRRSYLFNDRTINDISSELTIYRIVSK